MIDVCVPKKHLVTRQHQPFAARYKGVLTLSCQGILATNHQTGQKCIDGVVAGNPSSEMQAPVFSLNLQRQPQGTRAVTLQRHRISFSLRQAGIKAKNPGIKHSEQEPGICHQQPDRSAFVKTDRADLALGRHILRSFGQREHTNRRWRRA
jgi:hypothetical protein